jgi:hypothetical protein
MDLGLAGRSDKMTKATVDYRNDRSPLSTNSVWVSLTVKTGTNWHHFQKGAIILALRARSSAG